MADHSDSSPLVPPLPLSDPSEIDLEAGPSEQIQCRICLETDGRDFIAPCKCKGTSKYVHRECLDHWRAVKEGFAFAHCTTCKAPYHLRVHVAADRKWRTLKFRFFVTRDILFIFMAVQLVIASLAYLVYLIDGYQQYWLRLLWGFDSELSFYYICGALCFLPCLAFLGASLLVMIEEFAMIWLSLVENYVFVAVNQEFVQTVICQVPFVCGLIAPHALRVVEPWQQNVVVVWERIGGYYGRSTDMATSLSHTCKKDVNKGHMQACFRPIPQVGPHSHIPNEWSLQSFAALPFLPVEYVVEDVDGEMTGSDWSPPSLPPEHVQQLKTLGLL
ncbi:Zinc finger, RING-CH-type [Sesbania bispinosa]|nr:Zinc finger, RING-CH-type [Sesbania bispinosa]